MTVSSSRFATHIAGALTLTFMGLGGGCGGGSTPTGPGEGKGPGQGAEQGGPGEPGGETSEAAAAGPDCSDGSCAQCGDGICPQGFYCDEGAPGGAACQWLPDCAAQASCSCVQAALGAECQCEVRDGHPFVNCS